MKTASAISILFLIALTVACGYSAKASPPVAGSVPAISQLSPNSASAGGPGFIMTVNGSNFGSKAVVNWNGAAQSSNTSVINSKQLSVNIPAAMIATPGTAKITVTNPGTTGTGLYGGGGTLAETSSPMDFPIN
jgi:IPT/TIG domain